MDPTQALLLAAKAMNVVRGLVKIAETLNGEPLSDEQMHTVYGEQKDAEAEWEAEAPGHTSPE